MESAWLTLRQTKSFSDKELTTDLRNHPFFDDSKISLAYIGILKSDLELIELKNRFSPLNYSAFKLGR